MDIQGTTVLVLGGGGMVGRAVCRELIKSAPARIVVCSMFEAESRAAIEGLTEEFDRSRKHDPSLAAIEFVPEWGNLFVRESLRLLTGGQAVATPEGRAAIIEDTLSPLTREVAERFFLYQLIERYRPQVIIDAINTATGIAYSDVFSQARAVWNVLDQGPVDSELVQRLLCSLYIPQLIRHVDVLYRAMASVDTKAYVKLGTSGTGGMGWNIPYTHGEERPSSLLLSKSAVAGAHTLLLFLLARTPGIATFGEGEDPALVVKSPPATMEIKPTAMIGWREIGFGDILKRGQPVYLEEVALEQAEPLGETLQLNDPSRRLTDRKLRTVYVDTGENGLFSTEEFVAITSPGQMEFVTPEEIARNVVDEVRGINTGKDVINALNVTSMGPTFRAGYQRERAIKKLRELEKAHGCDSVAFENLGPPRLSKLLFECYLLKRTCPSMQAVAEASPADLQAGILALLREDNELLATPVSLGIPILLDGPRLLRGRQVKTPPPHGQSEVSMGNHLEEWARAGWVDLRVSNMERWKRRMAAMIADSHSIPVQETSSRYVRDRDFWMQSDPDSWPLAPGEVAAWIFINEDKGERGRE